jgi:hypothetical protein
MSYDFIVDGAVVGRFRSLRIPDERDSDLKFADLDADLHRWLRTNHVPSNEADDPALLSFEVKGKSGGHWRGANWRVYPHMFSQALVTWWGVGADTSFKPVKLSDSHRRT